MISKKIKALIMTCLAVTSLTSTSFAFTHDTYAKFLEDEGLLKGSDSGYELDRAPNRCEIAVMLIRLIGKEDEVLSGSYEHPFTDVPKWADKYIGYMYENNLTKGISKTEFGSSNSVDARDYGTFLLRALGYDDKKGDFSWNTALETCVDKNIITNYDAKNLSQKKFIRDDMVYMSFNALMSSVANDSLKLYEKLYQSGVISETSGCLFDIESKKNSVKDQTDSVIPKTVGVHYTLTEDLEGINMKFRTNNYRKQTVSGLANEMEEKCEDYISILDLGIDNNIAYGNFNFTSWYGARDLDGVRIIVEEDFDEFFDVVKSYDVFTEKLIDINGKSVELDSLAKISGLHVLEYIEAPDFIIDKKVNYVGDSSFDSEVSNVKISVPGKILYTSDRVGLIDANTAEINKIGEVTTHLIIFEPNTSK